MKTCEWIIFTEDGSEWCGKPCEGKNSLCATHSRLSRKMVTDAEKEAVKIDATLARAKIKNQQKRKPINKVSAKREELNKKYFKLVEQFKKDNPECKAKVNEYCTKKTEDPHHRRGRGAYLLEVSTWLPVCRSCHSFIESNPNIAKEKGWSSSRLEKENPVI